MQMRDGVSRDRLAPRSLVLRAWRANNCVRSATFLCTKERKLIAILPGRLGRRPETLPGSPRFPEPRSRTDHRRTMGSRPWARVRLRLAEQRSARHMPCGSRVPACVPRRCRLSAKQTQIPCRHAGCNQGAGAPLHKGRSLRLRTGLVTRPQCASLPACILEEVEPITGG